nr:MAG TPA: hypothetical protein [Caudoviricetes sp.]
MSGSFLRLQSLSQKMRFTNHFRRTHEEHF